MRPHSPSAGFSRVGRALAALVVFVAMTASVPLLAQRSGVGGGAVSLPTGPGSLEGLGESFQPSPSTGTGSHSIPLSATVGAGGMAPHLQLAYEGGGGNGLIGLGWSFGPGSIQRRTDKGVPRYVDGPNGVDDDFDGVVDNPEEIDVFIEPSGEDLVPVLDGALPGVTNYFCKIEGSFVRYRRVGDHWEATAPNGSKMFYGLTPSARIVDPAGTNHVFEWLLEKESDTHGNSVEYRYASFDGEANLNQKYLVEVRYGAGPGPWDNFHFVALQYEDRADWFEDCRAGFTVRTGKRLVRAEMGIQGPVLPGHAQGDFNGDGLTDNLNSRYVLGYDPASYRSSLVSVTLIGADGVTAYPSSTYQYTATRTDAVLSAAGQAVSSVNEPLSTFESAFVDLVDLNGDGLPDLLRTEAGGAGHYGYINQGQQGSNAPAIVWGPEQSVTPGGDGLAWNADLGNPTSHLEDIDGDGLVDLVQVGLDSVYYYRNAPGLAGSVLSWDDRAQLAVQDYPPPAPFGDPNVRTADLNFDKRIDIIRSIPVAGGAAYQIWYNLAQQTYSLRQTVTPSTGYLFSDIGVQLTDFNGDRVTDVARITPTGVLVTAGLGYGRFADERMAPLPDGETLSDDLVTRARLQDIDGDGLADLVVERAEPGAIWFWLNRGNYTFAPKRRITDLPAAVGNLSIRWADMNGNGTTDLVIADDGAIPHISVVDIGMLLGAVPRPGLLTEIRNGLGSVTQLEYRSSADYMLADGTDAGGNYQYAWRYPMPFPVDVVSREVISDSLGNTIETRYAYHDAYYDPVEKQFRGFARAEKTMVGDATSPDLVSRMTFDVGAVELAMKGKLLSASAEQADGKVFSTETNQWDRRVFATGLNGVVSRWAAMTNAVSTILELGAGAPKRVESDFDYDAFGNQTTADHWGVVDNGDRLAGHDEARTRKIYAYNTNDWLVRFPVRMEVSEAAGTVVNRIDYFYDDEAFSGNNAGAVTRGDATLVRTWYDLGKPDGAVRTQRNRFDAYGNVIVTLDPLGDPGQTNPGHAREFEFDPLFHQYAIREVQHIGAGHPDLVIQAAFDAGFGVTTSVTDANGFVSSSGYDVFGRVLWEIEPGDSKDFPTKEYRYADGLPTAAGGLISYTESRILDKAPGSISGASRDAYYHIGRTYSDGLGRTRLVKAKAEPDPATGLPRFTAAGGVLFNGKGEAAANLATYFSPTLEFEDITSHGWSGVFHLGGGLVSLSLSNAPTVRHVYDAMGRAVRLQLPDGALEETRFEPLKASTYDENSLDTNSPYFGKTAVAWTDGLGRTVQVDEVNKLTDEGLPAAEFAVWSTLYAYRADGVLLGLTDSQGNSKSMDYDAMGRLTALHDWDKGTIQTVYDDASNRIERRDAKGQRTLYTYDGANRLTSEDYLDDGSPEFSYGLKPEVVYDYDGLSGTVDLGGGAISAVTNSLGELSHVSYPDGEDFFAYDARGRSSWSVRRLKDPWNGRPTAFKTSYEYDSMDRVTRMVYPDDDFITFEYNERTVLRRIRGGPSGYIIADRSYTPTGQEEATTFGNGVQSHYAYDARLRMISAKTGGGASGPEDLVSYRYTFDPASNLQEIEDARPASVLPDGDARRNTQRFAYDSLYRLTGFQVSHAAPGAPTRTDDQIGYRYDRIGNLLAQQSTSGQSERGWPVADLGTLSYGGALGRFHRTGRSTTDPGPHALSRIDRNGESRSLQYDANGNVSELAGSAHYTWDFNDHLVGFADDVSRAEYRYDHRGRRISKKVFSIANPARAPTSTLYVSPNFEVRPNDEVVKYVFDGLRRVAQITGRVNATDRLERVRLFAGWNLRSLTLDTPGVAEALEAQGADGVRLWNPASKTLDALQPGQAAPAGSVLWIHAPTAAVARLTGVESSSPPREVGAGGAYFGFGGPKPLDLRLELPGGTAFWRHEASSNAWVIHDGLGAPPDDPSLLPPGEPAFILALSPVTLSTNLFATRIRYYHDDHLGSQAVVSDETGALVEESNYYPFGQLRNHWSGGADSVAYGFGGKERDDESGLHQFEARYLMANLGRFITVDPMERSGSPQDLNGYAFVGNRPTEFGDPTGLAKSLLGRIFGRKKAPAPMTVGLDAHYSSGSTKETYTSSESFVNNDHHTVIQFNKKELKKMRVVLNRKGLLVYKHDGKLVDSSTGGQQGGVRGGLGAGSYIFVQTKKGKIYMASCIPHQVHHSSFTGGEEVRMAGEMKVSNGKISYLSNASGHYQPKEPFLKAFHSWLVSKKANLGGTSYELWSKTGGVASAAKWDPSGAGTATATVAVVSSTGGHGVATGAPPTVNGGGRSVFYRDDESEGSPTQYNIVVMEDEEENDNPYNTFVNDYGVMQRLH